MAPRSLLVMNASWSGLASDVADIAEEWRANRPERQARRSLDPADFARLAKAGFLHVAVPEESGGLWRSVAETTRPICETLRTIAAADPSVALVASMHPAVLGFWLARPDEARPHWTEQRAAVFATAAEGAQWGTITSEPGSGGDILRTKAQATPDGSSDGPVPGAAYRISGDKHFGSGSGVTSFMITTAVADGEDEPALFALDVRDRAMGRHGRVAADRRVGRDGHGRDPEPRDAAGGVPGDPLRVGRTAGGAHARRRHRWSPACSRR